MGAEGGIEVMLIFLLKKEWYEKIKSGEKTIEYRKVKPYWSCRLAKEFEFNQYAFCSIGDRLCVCYENSEYSAPINIPISDYLDGSRK